MVHLPIPQTNPRANYLAHEADIQAAIQRVLDSGWYILGKEVSAFEEEFAAYLGGGYAVGVGNGTDALELALRACDIGPGDTVFTVSHTANATVSAIERTGASFVFVDIEPATFTMDPEHLEELLREHQGGRPKAILPVHLYGHPARMPEIMDIAERFGLSVIEDCAQSHGARLEEQPTGAWGDIATFSFYPTKNLGALGDGGLVFTRDERLAEKVRLLRQYGWRDRYVSLFPGVNSRLDEIQAALLRVKLASLDSENERRRSHAALYDQLLSGAELVLPYTAPGATHVFHQYVIRSERRDELKHYLAEQQVGTLIHYPVPIHLQPAYEPHRPPAGALAHTEKAAREILSLPLYPELQEDALRYVAERILAWQEAG